MEPVGIPFLQEGKEVKVRKIPTSTRAFGSARNPARRGPYAVPGAKLRNGDEKLVRLWLCLSKKGDEHLCCSIKGGIALVICCQSSPNVWRFGPQRRPRTP